MVEIEVKVKVIESDGKQLEFKEAIPINSIKFVGDGITTFHGSIDKLKTWFSDEQIIQFFEKKMNIQLFQHLNKIGKKMQSRSKVNMVDLATKVFENFSGQSVKERVITKFIQEQFPDNHPTTASNWK